MGVNCPPRGAGRIPLFAYLRKSYPQTPGRSCGRCRRRLPTHTPGGPAGHKGYGLLLVCELLAGALGGAGCSGDDDIVQEDGNGVFLLAANPASFGPVEEFSRRVEGLFKRLKECPTAPGVEEVLSPGEVEARTAQQRREEGIPLEDETWRQIQEVAAKVGCSEEIFT